MATKKKPPMNRDAAARNSAARWARESELRSRESMSANLARDYKAKPGAFRPLARKSRNKLPGWARPFYGPYL